MESELTKISLIFEMLPYPAVITTREVASVNNGRLLSLKKVFVWIMHQLF